MLSRIWIATSALCAGTWWGSVNAPVQLATVVLGCGALLMMLRRRPTRLAAIALVCIGVGAVNAHLRFAPRGPLTELARQVPKCEVSGSILESTSGLGTLVEVHHLTCGEWVAGSVGVASIADELGPSGGGFEATGWLVPLGDDPFDRARWRAGARAALHASHLEVTGRPSGPHAIAERVREGLGAAVSGLDARRAALLEGLSIGDTSGLDPTTIQIFRNAGLSHVLAVSGSNVAIVLGAVLVGMRSVSLRVRVAAGYVVLGIFLLVVGPDASVLRAGAMGAIALVCLIGGRTAEPLAALGLAVMAVISLRPGMLFSVGMQLSAAATAGIVIFCNPIERRMLFLPASFRLMLSATLAAQLAVAPILILVFGELSLVAPAANALALPAVGPATVIALVAGTLSAVLAPVGRALAVLVSPAAGWILWVADRLGGLERSLVHVPNWTGWPLLAVVAVLAAAVLAPREAGSAR